MITSLNMKVANISTKLNIEANSPEWKSLCKDCYSATQKAGWTQKDSKNLLKEIRKRGDF